MAPTRKKGNDQSTPKGGPIGKRGTPASRNGKRSTPAKEGNNSAESHSKRIRLDQGSPTPASTNLRKSKQSQSSSLTQTPTRGNKSKSSETTVSVKSKSEKGKETTSSRSTRTATLAKKESGDVKSNNTNVEEASEPLTRRKKGALESPRGSNKPTPTQTKEKVIEKSPSTVSTRGSRNKLVVSLVRTSEDNEDDGGDTQGLNNENSAKVQLKKSTTIAKISSSSSSLKPNTAEVILVPVEDVNTRTSPRKGRDRKGDEGMLKPSPEIKEKAVVDKRKSSPKQNNTGIVELVDAQCISSEDQTVADASQARPSKANKSMVVVINDEEDASKDSDPEDNPPVENLNDNAQVKEGKRKSNDALDEIVGSGKKSKKQSDDAVNQDIKPEAIEGELKSICPEKEENVCQTIEFEAICPNTDTETNRESSETSSLILPNAVGGSVSNILDTSPKKEKGDESSPTEFANASEKETENSALELDECSLKIENALDEMAAKIKDEEVKIELEQKLFAKDIADMKIKQEIEIEESLDTERSNDNYASKDIAEKGDGLMKLNDQEVSSDDSQSANIDLTKNGQDTKESELTHASNLPIEIKEELSDTSEISTNEKDNEIEDSTILGTTEEENDIEDNTWIGSPEVLDIKEEEIDGFEVVAEWSSFKSSMVDETQEVVHAAATSESGCLLPPSVSSKAGNTNLVSCQSQDLATTNVVKSCSSSDKSLQVVAGSQDSAEVINFPQGVSLPPSKSSSTITGDDNRKDDKCDQEKHKRYKVTAIQADIPAQNQKSLISSSTAALIKSVCSPPILTHIIQSNKVSFRCNGQTYSSVFEGLNGVNVGKPESYKYTVALETDMETLLDVAQDDDVAATAGNVYKLKQNYSKEAQIKVLLSSGKSAVINVVRCHSEDNRSSPNLILQNSSKCSEEHTSSTETPSDTQISEEATLTNRKQPVVMSIVGKEKATPGIMVLPSKATEDDRQIAFSAIGKITAGVDIAEDLDHLSHVSIEKEHEFSSVLRTIYLCSEPNSNESDGRDVTAICSESSNSASKNKRPSIISKKAEESNLRVTIESKDDSTDSLIDSSLGFVIPRPYGTLSNAERIFYDHIGQNCPLSPRSRAFAETFIKQPDFLDNDNKRNVLVKLGWVPVNLKTAKSHFLTLSESDTQMSSVGQINSQNLQVPTNSAASSSMGQKSLGSLPSDGYRPSSPIVTSASKPPLSTPSSVVTETADGKMVSLLKTRPRYLSVMIPSGQQGPVQKTAQTSPTLPEGLKNLEPEKVILPKRESCPVPGCDGKGHITGQYTHHRSASGCPRRSSLGWDMDSLMSKEDRTPRCPTKGCNGRGHINNNRSSHRSVSGCPLAAMNRLMSSNRKEGKNDLHVVVLPKSDDPTKAMIATCSEKELIKLAAKEITPAGTDRVLRPMILTKQLEPRESNSTPQVTPRGNLAKELEKYSRPELGSTFSFQQDEMGSSAAQSSVPGTSHLEQPTLEAQHSAPERPNILSKRPHMRHRPSVLSRSRVGGSTGNKILDAAAAIRSISPSSVSSSSSSSLFIPSPAPTVPLEQQTASSNLTQGFLRSNEDSEAEEDGDDEVDNNADDDKTNSNSSASPMSSRSHSPSSILMIKTPRGGGSPQSFLEFLTPRSGGSRQKSEATCPTPGCDGSGHVTGNYTSHRSLSGCPLADRATVQANQVEQKCPTPGCDGSGHVTGNYASHRSLSGCPRAAKIKKMLMKEGEKKETDDPLRASGCPIANKQRGSKPLSGTEFDDIEGEPWDIMQDNVCESIFSPLTSSMKRAHLSSKELAVLHMKAQAGEDLEAEGNALALLNEEIEDLEASNKRLDSQVAAQMKQVSNQELQLINMVCDNEAAETRVDTLRKKLSTLQETFLRILKPLMQEHPQLGDPDAVDKTGVVETVSRLYELVNKTEKEVDKDVAITETAVSAIKTAFSEISVI